MMAYKNREDERIYKRGWYQRNKKKVKARVRRNNDRYRQECVVFVQELKNSTPCADCGKRFHFSAMDFDHVRGDKYMEVSLLVRRAFGLKRVKEEISKCDIVCSNCHRVRTWMRLGSPTEEAPDSSPGQ